MNPIKPIILSGLYHLKFFDIVRLLQRSRVNILMYHQFSDKHEPFKIHHNVFENQIKFLQKKCNFISLKHYSEILNGQREDYPDNAIILTIDDGYRDNFTFAYPILKKYSVPATIFLTTDFISHKSWLWANKLEYILKNSQLKKFGFQLHGKTVQFRVDNFKNWHRTQLNIFYYCCKISDDKKNEFLKELAKYLNVDVPEQTGGDVQPLTWDQIREMSDNGIDFGSHTCSHPILSRLTNEQLEHELNDSKKTIEEKVCSEVSLFCYPNGTADDFDCNVVEMLKNASYSAAVTTILGCNQSQNQDPFFLRRVSISNDNKRDIFRELTCHYEKNN